MRDKISVIVPVFKVERYLNECVTSIVNQTYDNLEIILVDDGSPDKCPQMCDEWADKDSRIKVVHKKNGGLSSARNAGMEHASGEFVMFVDSDDFIEQSMAYDLMQAQNDTHADVVCCEINRYKDGVYTLMDIFHSSVALYTITSTQFLNMLFLTKVSCASWNKLYRRDVLHDVSFPEGVYNEDIVFLYNLFQNRNITVALINKALYNYRITPNSVTTTFGKRNMDYLYNAQNFQKHILENRQDLYDSFNVYMARVAIDIGWALIKNKSVKLYEKDFEYCKKCISGALLKILFVYPLPLRWKIYSVLILLR